MATSTDSRTRWEFTRGEKCILAHLAATFLCLVCVVAVYLVHVCVVKHEGSEAFRLTRRTLPPSEDVHAACVGAAWVGARAACTSVLVGARWSITAARCVAARSHAHLSHLLPYWSLRYSHGMVAGRQSAVSRGITHPQYEPEQQVSDVGLFEHAADILPVPEPPALRAIHCSLPTKTIAEDELHKINDINIVKWQNSTNGRETCLSDALSAAKCSRLVSAVVLRETAHEVCLKPSEACDLAAQPLGAAVFVRGRLAGVASWGDLEAASPFPLVMLQLAPYKQWIDTTIAL